MSLETIAFWRKPVKAFGQTHLRKKGADTTLCGKKIPTNRPTGEAGPSPCPRCERFRDWKEAIDEKLPSGDTPTAAPSVVVIHPWNGGEKYKDHRGRTEPPSKAYGENAHYVGNLGPQSIVFDSENHYLVVVSQGLGSTVVKYQGRDKTDSVTVARGMVVYDAKRP